MLDYASFPDQRQTLIKTRLLQDGRVVCAQLAAELGVSEHTIRRDLQELASQGVCKKVYGGAVNVVADPPGLAERIHLTGEEKQKLGRASAQLLRAGDCVFVDSGSTNMAIAKAISQQQAITFVTHVPEIAVELLKLAHCEVILLGGKLNRKIGASVGPATIRQLETMYFDQCLLGACALDPEEGVTVFDFDDAEFKRTIVKQSSEVIVALTQDKLGTVAKHRVMQVSEISTLVLAGASVPGVLAKLAQSNVNIVQAD
ncbi:DeoR/GlpR family DNA-binding transcription regulator [Shewanella amazonensis]|uniref:DeoR-family transcriptional regulator n=1 Tax=Shewanella amazonensis (strain ATCC BAA-1098 / SB2B) TaxID=326297 RepID=A1S9R5_SHEAM|nr:DeoR/GlpR family DNA-binding transcription regulator [Shewanella amazonensis]ABM01122.1 DeoR-family transcriptional regulator [Shewanella amazonensis SB2B]